MVIVIENTLNRFDQEILILVQKLSVVSSITRLVSKSLVMKLNDLNNCYCINNSIK